jgi:16S rRNA processing protein RimM
MPRARSRRVLLGRIVHAHGNRGEVAIVAYTAEPRDIAAYGPLADADGALFTITQTRTTAKGVVARLKGIEDRTAAEALKGVELYVDRDRLPAAADGEFYHADLIGLAVVDREGRTIGKIVAVQNFGAGDIIEVGLLGSRATQFVPFTETYVPEVDVRGGRVVVALPSLGEKEAE